MNDSTPSRKMTGLDRERIDREHRAATWGGFGLFAAIAALMAAAVLFVSKIPAGEVDYVAGRARLPCAMSIWFALFGILLLSMTRLFGHRLVGRIEEGTASPNLLRLGSIGYLKRVTVVIWAECALGTVMGFAHWVSGRLVSVDNLMDLAPFYLLSVSAALIFVPKRATWLMWLEGRSEPESPLLEEPTMELAIVSADEEPAGETEREAEREPPETVPAEERQAA